MIWRVRERAAFERLRTEGVRIRPLTSLPPSGASNRRRSLWCSYLPDAEPAPPRVAFVIGRKVGPAVVRNRLRRQIRSVLAEVQCGKAVGFSEAGMTPGSYLFGAHSSVVELNFGELRSEVLGLLAGVDQAVTDAARRRADDLP